MGGDPTRDDIRIERLNEDVGEIKLSVGIMANKLEQIETTLEHIGNQPKQIPGWLVAVMAIPSTLIALFLLILTIEIYLKL